MEIVINNIREIKVIFSELSYILNRKQKKQSLKVLAIIIVSSWLEMIGVSAVLPFVQAIISPEVLLQNAYIQKILRLFNIEASTKTLLLVIGIGMMLVYVIKNLFMIFSLFLQNDYNTKIQKDLSNTMLHSYMNRPYTFFLETNSSIIMRGSTDNIFGIYQILSSIMSMSAEIISVIMIGIYIVFTDFWTAIAALLLMLTIVGGIVFFFRPTIKRIGQKNMEVVAAKNKAIYQAVSGIKEIFVMQRQKYFEKEYEQTSEIHRNVQRNYGFISACPDRIVEGICISGLIGVICIRLLTSEEMLNFIPKLAVFAMAAFKVLPSVGKISSRMSSIIYYRPMLLDTYNNMKEVNEYVEEQKKYIQKNSTYKDSIRNLRFVSHLLINQVVWKYKNQQKEVLSKTTLVIEKGQSVGLIGASGAGKTTLVDMILGLLKPQEGSIEMDGIDIYTIPHEWSHMVGYVPQAVFLMDDTVRNNVCFGLKIDDKNDEMVWEALERAQLKAFIQSLPNGLDTIVGERGVKFSGGQRQRIAIARALYCKPEILILDEATAALDNETEAAVMESIDLLQGQITMIIVAHRLTTIKKCDVVYEIVDGQAIQRDKEGLL